MRIERLAPGESADAWAGALASLDPARAEVLKEDSGAAVYRAKLLGRDIILKRWELASLGSRLKGALRAGRADRHWRGAEWLTRVGIPTARCLALASEIRRPFPRAWLAMEAVTGKTLLDTIASDIPVRDQHAIARAVGSQIDAFRSHLRSNRDHKPSNLIVTGDPAAPEIAVIDCVGLRRRPDPEGMLASLLIEPTGCGLRVRKTLIVRVLRSYVDALRVAANLSRDEARERRDLVWREVSERIRLHGDPRPRVNPLGSSRP